MSARTAAFWLVIAVGPVAALWVYGLIQSAERYEGTCGLLSRSFSCTKWEYIEDTLISAFVAPGLIAASVAWLLLVALIGVVFFLFRKPRAA